MAETYNKCHYLAGDNIRPHGTREARALIGSSVLYLRPCDIDKSGRGLFFPQSGIITAVCGRWLAIDEPQNFCINIGQIVEMVAIQETK